mgnify:CR=1 FL=1|nr:MAG TPA: TFIIB zinc-binding [Caudoviricetes sp.]
MAGAIRICSHNIDGFGSCDIMADGVCVQGPCHAEELVEYAPVVHGQWEWLGPNRLVTDCMCGTCSACKVRSKYIVNTMLCPNCGAKMGGGEG